MLITGQPGGPRLHTGLFTVLLSRVTAPFRASARPARVVAVVSVMLVIAMIVPAMDVEVPSVAELPTCQNTLQARPPLMMETEEPLAVTSVLPVLKMKTAAGLPCALRVNVPVNAAPAEKQ